MYKSLNMKDKQLTWANTCSLCQGTGIIWGKGFPTACPYCSIIIR